MRYYPERHREFGIPYGGDVETPILKFLYHRRKIDEKKYYVVTIARAIGISDRDSVREALNRLFNRSYVEKFKEGRYTLWRLRDDAEVKREVEERIGYRRPTPMEHHP